MGLDQDGFTGELNQAFKGKKYQYYLIYYLENKPLSRLFYETIIWIIPKSEKDFTEREREKEKEGKPERELGKWRYEGCNKEKKKEERKRK